MINLLPSENQREIAQEQTWKMIMILGTLILTSFISFSLILFSVNLFISENVESQKIQFEEKEKDLRSKEMKSLEADLVTFNEKISKLDSFYATQFGITGPLAKISTVFPADTYLNNLAINLQTSKEGVLEVNCNISGFSSTRENLLKLKENLEKEESFREIYFPPADWMKATSVNFTASFKLK